MTIPAIKSFTDYNKYKTESGYTKQGELQQFMQNQNDCLTALTSTMLWQPETTYAVDKIIVSPTMPTGTRARVTTEGKTGDTEPTWTAAGTTVSDGTAAFTMESLNYVQLIATAVEEMYKKALLDAHPVGSYYFSNDPTDPGTLFGGTWEAVAPGYGLIAQGTATAEDGTKLTFTAGNKYGEFKHQLNVGELATDKLELVGIESGERTVNSVQGNFTITKVWQNGKLGPVTSDVDSYGFGYLTTNGKNQYHNNVSPAIAIYCWKRTA